MKDHTKSAAAIWEELSGVASSGATLTYKELGSRVGRHHRSLRLPLGLIQEYCIQNALPPLTALVVLGDGKGPGTGFTASTPDKLAEDLKRVQNYPWQSLGNPFRSNQTKVSKEVADEGARRRALWASLTKRGRSDHAASVLRELGIYGGAQGIWVNLKQTRRLASNGVAVSILHTGKYYPDDVSADGLIYHYPSTDRPAGRDKAEVLALKEARALSLPIFVIKPGSTYGTRHVEIGWVDGWDDDAQQFLILTGEDKPAKCEEKEEEAAPFNLTDNAKPGTTTTKTRPGQAAFRFHVLEKYGCKCAVCSITQAPLIKAAHICGKAHKGSDDWRNGIPLCSTHHDAFDAHMFTIQPDSKKLKTRPGISRSDIGLIEQMLTTIRRTPHMDALKWRHSYTEKVWKSEKKHRHSNNSSVDGATGVLAKAKG